MLCDPEGGCLRARARPPSGVTRPCTVAHIAVCVSPAKGRFLQEAMSEGAGVVRSAAETTLQPSDQRRPGFDSVRPGRSVPPREADRRRATLLGKSRLPAKARDLERD